MKNILIILILAVPFWFSFGCMDFYTEPDFYAEEDDDDDDDTDGNDFEEDVCGSKDCECEPRRLGSIDHTRFFDQIAVADNYIYAISDGDLIVYDALDPSDVKMIGGNNEFNNPLCLATTTNDRLVLLDSDWGDSRISILDISHPDDITSGFPVLGDRIFDSKSDMDYFVMNGANSLTGIAEMWGPTWTDTTTSYAYYYQSDFLDPEAMINNATELDRENTMTAVAADNGYSFLGYSKTDFDNTTGIFVKGLDTGLSTTTETESAVRFMHAAGDFLYVALDQSRNNFAVYDIEDPSNAEFAGEFTVDGNIYYIDIKDDLAYLVTSIAVQVLDISDPTDIELYANFGRDRDYVTFDQSNADVVYLLHEDKIEIYESCPQP